MNQDPESSRDVFDWHDFADTSTSFLHHVALLPRLEESLVKTKTIGLVVIDIGPLDTIEQTYGAVILQKILNDISLALQDMSGVLIRSSDLVAMSELGSSSFMIFLTNERKKAEKKCLTLDDVETIADRVQAYLIERLTKILHPYSKGFPRMSVGYAVSVYNPMIRKRRLIARLIEEARDMARERKDRLFTECKNELQRIIVHQDITSVFQPIVTLADQQTVAFEALTRGPKGSMFEMPLIMYALAAETGLLLELDQLCRFKALVESRNFSSDYDVFVNTLPDSIHDPDFKSGGYAELMLHINKSPKNYVFEINERSAINDFQNFRTSMAEYLSLGTHFALDDIGTGYSSLTAMMELKPKYIKLDKDLARGISHHPVKQETLGLFLAFAEKIQSEVIAEGVETQDELDFLRDHGVRLAQGFYFCEPLPAEHFLNN